MALIKINNRSSEDTAIHGRRNLIINGAMNVAQRGTSFTGITSTIAYRMDRWQVGFGAAGSNYSITQSTDAPDNFKYSIKWQRTASNAVTNSIWFSQAFESVNSKVVAGKTCTLSYYAKKGANYSATSSDIQVRIISGTGTDQSATSAITAGWTGYATPLSTTQVITSSWVRYTHTVTFASNINQISVNLASNSAGTAGADDSLQITGIQLEVGSQATPFEHRSYGEELDLCYRYYVKYHAGGSGVFSRMALGYMRSTTNLRALFTFPREMRTTPALDDDNAGNYHIEDASGNSDVDATVGSISQGGFQTCLVNFTTGSLTDNQPAHVGVNNSTDALVGLGFDAEL
jgi:hypothetical protein